jgi:hypothetical protein
MFPFFWVKSLIKLKPNPLEFLILKSSGNPFPLSLTINSKLSASIFFAETIILPFSTSEKAYLNAFVINSFTMIPTENKDLEFKLKSSIFFSMKTLLAPWKRN